MVKRKQPERLVTLGPAAAVVRLSIVLRDDATDQEFRLILCALLRSSSDTPWCFF